jgi:O-antigen ligase
MRLDSGTAAFWLTAASAAASLVSIAAMEILLGAAVLLLIYTLYTGRRPSTWPSFLLPLGAFMVTTLISLAASPDPSVGWHPIQKFVLFSMVFVAAAFVTTETRALSAYKFLLLVGAASAVLAIGQFVMKEIDYLRSGGDDPTLVNRITGPLGHWMTFSGVELLVWCAAIPALTVLGRRWIPAALIIGAALVLSSTRGVWLGAVAGFAFVAPALPRRVLAGVLAVAVLVGAAASPFIYRRISMSFDSSLATNYSRKVYSSVGLEMIQARPLFGVGPERIDDEFSNFYSGDVKNLFLGHLHNNILQLGAERGLLALAAFLWFLTELYRSLLKQMRSLDEDRRWIPLASLGSLTAFVVAGLTEYNFGDSEVLVLLLFIVSVPFGLAAHVQEDPDRQPG